MEVDIELYRIFYFVAKFKNITKASEKLYISQPAVTMSIKKLEAQLNTTLFIRTKRGVILTSEGEVLFDYISKAMENINMGENRLQSLKKLDSGNIKIGIGTTLTKYFLVDYLKQYHKLYPMITINIDTSITNVILKKLQEGLLDIAIIVSDSNKISNLNIEYSKDIEYIFVSDKKYFDMTKGKLNVDNINEYPMLVLSQVSNSRAFLDEYLNKYNCEIMPAMELTSHSLVKEFAKIGMGIGFTLSEYVKDELKKGELFKIDITPKVPSQKILILTRKGYIPSFSSKKLIEVIKSYDKHIE